MIIDNAKQISDIRILNPANIVSINPIIVVAEEIAMMICNWRLYGRHKSNLSKVINPLESAIYLSQYQNGIKTF